MAECNVTKAVFLNAAVCRTLGWYILNTETAAPSIADRFRLEEGQEIHRRAQGHFPSGVSAAHPDIDQAIQRTSTLLTDEVTTTIFEATFRVDGYTARADILQREEKGWKLIEIKSSVNDKQELLDDLAYSTMVLRRWGLPITQACLMLVSNDYRRGMSDHSLFIEIDHTDAAVARADEFLELWNTVYVALNQEHRPEPSLILDCRNCPYFESDCLGVGMDNHIFDLPRLHQTKFNSLNEMGVNQINDILDDFNLTDNQSVVRAAILSGQPIAGSSSARGASSQ